MPFWKPKKTWEGLDVFLIGGGTSLERFDWDLLKSEMTIGCNMAFSHGPEICKICIFGDSRFFKVFEPELEVYANSKGIVFTSVPQLQKSKHNWIWKMPRERHGLHYDAFGWNDNTGAEAINLALLLGAKKIYLLGYDMKLSDNNKANWHNRILQKPNATVYPRFVKEFTRVQTDLKKKFPGREVINITDDNKLTMFPAIGVDEFWNERIPK